MLSRYLGNAPIIKILSFLIKNEDQSYNLVEIRDKAKLGYSTLKRELPKMIKNKLIKVDRTLGKIKLYKVNSNSRVIKALSIIK